MFCQHELAKTNRRNSLFMNKRAEFRRTSSKQLSQVIKKFFFLRAVQIERQSFQKYEIAISRKFQNLSNFLKIFKIVLRLSKQCYRVPRHFKILIICQCFH